MTKHGAEEAVAAVNTTRTGTVAVDEDEAVEITMMATLWHHGLQFLSTPAEETGGSCRMTSSRLMADNTVCESRRLSHVVGNCSLTSLQGLTSSYWEHTTMLSPHSPLLSTTFKAIPMHLPRGFAQLCHGERRVSPIPT